MYKSSLLFSITFPSRLFPSFCICILIIKCCGFLIISPAVSQIVLYIFNFVPFQIYRSAKIKFINENWWELVNYSFTSYIDKFCLAEIFLFHSLMRILDSQSSLVKHTCSVLLRSISDIWIRQEFWLNYDVLTRKQKENVAIQFPALFFCFSHTWMCNSLRNCVVLFSYRLVLNINIIYHQISNNYVDHLMLILTL